MSRFEYVMVLVSIIVGLSIAHSLLGVGRLIDRWAEGARLRWGWAYALWLGYVFIWTIQFWWWEFRFSELNPTWTMGLYLFLISYSIVLFLLAVILVPHSWDSVSDLDNFFIQRKAWFYWTLAVGNCIDLVDSYLKGGVSYIVNELGVFNGIFWLLVLVACVVGLRSERRRHHQVMAAAIFICQIVLGFVNLPTLGF